MKMVKKIFFNYKTKQMQQVINGNNIDILKQFPDNYFDAVVTDPPYGLGKEPNAAELMKDWIEYGYHEVGGSGFMGKEWDAFVPQPIFWKEVYRVLKHGGHVLSFFGTRTYDWGVMSMRFAGFEVRDCIQWLYGSGFPKSHNISKALDKMKGAEREVIGKKERGSVEEAKERGVGFLSDPANRNNTKQFGYGTELITAPSTDAAKQWDGWGSALKPANEPIVLARKPLEKGLSIAENILKWGVGGINIDASRIGTEQVSIHHAESSNSGTLNWNIGDKKDSSKDYYTTLGRFPANIILDEISAEILDEQSGVSKSQKSERGNIINNNVYGKYKEQEDTLRGHSDKGGASRFFYVAKASKSERNKGLEDFEAKRMEGRDEGQDERSVAFKARPTPMANIHPTVKPIKLMEYLVKMITPPNGIVLDPFVGSGTTGIAAKLLGFDFVGIEQDADYCKIAQARICNYPIERKKSETPKEDNQITQLDLF